MSDFKIDVKSRPVEVMYDRGRDWRARIGFVLIPTDGIIEREMTQYAPPGVGMHFTRRPGLRIAVSMPDKTGETQKLMDCIKDQGWEIQSGWHARSQG